MRNLSAQPKSHPGNVSSVTSRYGGRPVLLPPVIFQDMPFKSVGKGMSGLRCQPARGWGDGWWGDVSRWIRMHCVHSYDTLQVHASRIMRCYLT